jgi:hypothetical protein
MSYGWLGDRRHERVERLVLAVERVERLATRRLVEVVGRA